MLCEACSAAESHTGRAQHCWRGSGDVEDGSGESSERIKELESDLEESPCNQNPGRKNCFSSRQVGRVQSECAVLQRKLLEAQKPEVRTEIVEKEVLSDTAKATLKVARKQIGSYSG